MSAADDGVDETRTPAQYAYEVMLAMKLGGSAKVVRDVAENAISRAIAAERVAAGLDAPAKPAVDREGFTTLLDAVKWVLNDAAFKAPEQMGEVAERWVARLERAIDSLPPSLTKGGAS